MKSFFLLFFVIISTLIYCQDLRFAGVRFQSKAEKRTLLTSIKLNEGNPIELKGDFTVSFDVSFWTSRNFGNIFRILEPDNKILLNVIYNQFRSDDTSFIQFSTSDKKGIETSILKKELYDGKWYNFRLFFNTISKSVSVSVNDNFVGIAPADVQDINNLSFCFGIWDFNNINDNKIPGINIRNIVLSSAKNKYQWVLDPLINEGIYDTQKKLPVKIVNGSWLRVGHYKWNLLKSYPTHKNRTGVAFDEATSSLFLDRKENLVILNLKTLEDTVIKYENLRPAWWNDVYYNSVENVLYSSAPGASEVSVLDFNTRRWSEVNMDFSKNKDHFGSMNFFDNYTNSLFVIGGYGKYRANNVVKRYNFLTNVWEEVSLNSNSLKPLFAAGISSSLGEGKYLLFGGKGNNSGLQEDIFKRLYDFHLVDLKELTIKKIGTTPDSTLFNSLSPSIGYNKADSTFYILRHYSEPGEYKSTIEVLTGSLSNLRLKNKGAPLLGRDDDLRAYRGRLFYSESLKKVIVLMRDDESSNLSIYTIDTPLLGKDDFEKILPVINGSNKFAPFFIVAIVFLAAGSFVVLKKTTSKKSAEETAEIIPLSNSYQDKIRKEMKIFGGFSLYNNEGEDISSRFSAKLKELFLFILSRSVISNHNYGVTTEELNTMFWPDASPENVKSSRGVAINKIRKILSDTGVKIVFENKIWTIHLEDDYKLDILDYFEFKKEFKDEDPVDDEQVVKITELLSNGEILKGLSYDWLEARKVSLNQDIINYLTRLCERYTGKPPILLMLADAILAFDPVEETGFNFKMKALLEENKTSAAYSVYQLFSAEYRKLYSKDYPVSFNDISGV